MAKSKKKAAKKPARKVAKKASKKSMKKVVKRVAGKPVKTTGKKFLLIYHVPTDAMTQTANSSSEQLAEGMARWMAWARRCGSKLVDMGSPLANGRSLNSEGSLAPSTRQVTGYSVLEAEDWHEVFSLLDGHPHISGWHPEATIEVHETMIIPGM